MKAADTSPVVAAFASWHESHDAAASGAEFFTCDRRAMTVYERYGVQTHFL